MVDALRPVGRGTRRVVSGVGEEVPQLLVIKDGLLPSNVSCRGIIATDPAGEPFACLGSDRERGAVKRAKRGTGPDPY